MDVEKIKNYYKYSQWFYNVFYSYLNANSMHHGIWTNEVKNLKQACEKTNQIIIDKTGITKSNLVLDAGCGIAGTATYIAQKTGAKIKGISISAPQVKQAKNQVLKRNLNNLIKISQQNYTKTNFPNNTFDVIYAVESACYAYPKKDFTDEAFRILKPGGKIIIVDGYTKNLNMNQEEKKMLDVFKTAFALDYFGTSEEMTQALKNSKFKIKNVEDYSKKVLPTVIHLEFLRKKLSPIINLCKYIPHPFTQAGYQNAEAVRSEAYFMKSGHVSYVVHIAEKPKT